MLEKYAERIEKFLAQTLPQEQETPLHCAMRYSTLDGGKRIRAALLYATGASLGTSLDDLDWGAAAVECIHAYSLVHDDLPAMDNDDLRRGKPSTHRAFGEAQAILAADALNTFAFSLLTKSQLSPQAKIEQISILAHAAGAEGMVWGQSLDMFYTDKVITSSKLQEIHQHKTAELIAASLLLAAASRENFACLKNTFTEIGLALGMAYQIADDLADSSKTSQELGKTAGKDAAQNKNTFVSIYGIDASRKILENYQQEIHAKIQSLPLTSQQLPLLLEEIFSLFA